MGSHEVRHAIRSTHRLVAIEAPAGCGKTHEAVEAAVDLSAALPPDRELLLLAHTNAAVGEFRRRVRRSRARVRALTLDAFALELVAPYGDPLGLPIPVIPGDGPGEVPFSHLARRAAELLRRAPTLAAALGRHYPVIFLDEHQDTRVDQHEVVRLVVEAGGGRLCTFADPMQAIYDIGDTGALVDWEAQRRDADRAESLEDPWRWNKVPDLGRWILRAREALKSRRPLPLALRPDCVTVLRVPDLRDIPNPHSTRVQPVLLRLLPGVVRNLAGSYAVLTRYNAHVRGLNSALRGRVIIQEGTEFRHAYAALDTAQEFLGHPQQMALVLVSLLRETCTGLTEQVIEQISVSLLSDRIDRGRRERILPVLDCMEPLYVTPDLITWCRSLACILTHPRSWLKVDLPLNLRVLAQLRPSGADSARQLLDQTVQRYREGAPLLRHCVSTVHKAKGQEYDHVVLVHCSKSVFPDTEVGRRLLYTAISRAKTSITLIAPVRGASPLLC